MFNEMNVNGAMNAINSGNAEELMKHLAALDRQHCAAIANATKDFDNLEARLNDFFGN